MKKQTVYNKLKKKYHHLLEPLREYIIRQGYRENTILQYLNYTSFFFEWTQQAKVSIQDLEYSDLLAYIRYCSDNKDSVKLINRKILAVRKYYEYLRSKGKTGRNPASGLFLRGKRKGLPRHLFDREQLQKLYESYQPYDLRTARNKVILSLVINQGVTTGELSGLEPGHINLKTGKIRIPGSRHSNPRTLTLESYQIMELQEYLQQTRPEILRTIKQDISRPARKVSNPDTETLKTRLFISLNGSLSLKNSLLHFVKALRQINSETENLRQLRQSVIADWLKTKDVRTVQYMAGHKWVSTTERYQVNHLKDLQEALKQHHPLSNTQQP